MLMNEFVEAKEKELDIKHNPNNQREELEEELDEGDLKDLEAMIS